MFSNCNSILEPLLWFLGAFILGYLLRLFLNSRKMARLQAELDAKDAMSGSGVVSGEGSYSSGVATGTEPVDTEDFKVLEGIGPKVESILNANGLSSYSSLAKTDPSELRAMLDKEGGRFRYLDPTSWPQQASLADDGRWSELEELQEELIGGVYYGPVGQYKDADDLKRIEGVGPRVEGLLNNSGIHTWKQLADSEVDGLKNILNVAGGRYRDMNPTSWPRQANLAANGKWKELDELQEELIGGEYVMGGAVGSVAGSESDDLKAIEGIGSNVAELLNNAGINSFEDLSAKSPQELRLILDKEGERFENLDPSSWPRQAWLATSGRWEELSELQDELIGGLYVGPVGKTKGSSDLSKIEGITPRVEGLLSSAGIKTFEDLATTDSVKLRGILTAAGSPYNSLDTSSWANQARLAADEKWDDLSALQDKLVMGAYGTSGSGESAATEGDDLREIEGIGRSAAKALNDSGITTFRELAAKSPEELSSILSTHGDKFAGLDTSSWPRQAAIAADGNWDELDSLQGELIAGVALGKPVKNDLKIVEGIGMKIEGLLNEDGIHTWEKLSQTSPEHIKGILDKAGPRYRMHKPDTWPQQAALAHAGKWDELAVLQEKLIGGVHVDDLKVIEGVGFRMEELLKKDGIRTWKDLAETDPNRLKEMLSKHGNRYAMLDPTSWPRQAALATVGNWDELATLQDELIAGRIGQSDDLKQIEGIGPKVESLLKGAGITTFEQLANSSSIDLQTILDNAGDRYSLVDPASWTQQAQLAQSGNWSQLASLQAGLNPGTAYTSGAPVPKAKAPAKAAASGQKDDLKKVEGIGPKIEGLLNADGIMTWRQLSQAQHDRLKRILDDAGPRYRIHDPTTWPRQAGLAADGKWDELEKLQDELKGGREN